MKWCACWILLGLLFASGLEAQGTVVLPEPRLDPARAELRNALLILRDSLSTIDAAAARLQRDYREASPPLLLGRARVMRDACARSARTIPPTRSVVFAADMSDERRLRRRIELTKALDQLQGMLTRCETEFAAMSKPDKAEQVRDYANNRATRVQSALRRYEKTLGQFFAAMGIKVMPLGSGPTPLAG
jgi:hypothetical protein